MTEPIAPLDRNLLRAAGEHLGTLAERAYETYSRYHGHRGSAVTAGKFYQKYAKLARLSKDVLEVSRD